MTQMLEINDLKLEVNGRPIAESLSFKVPSGQLYCLSGPSGIGKTTLVRAIAGLHTVKQGTITVNDVCFVKDGKEIVPCHLRKVGYAPQQPSLYPHMTVMQNLTFFLQGSTPEEETQKATSILERLKIADKKSSYPHQLSGGQAQRVAIARAMINDPQILLFDETLSGVHAELAAKVGKIIADMIAEKRIPGILISHDLQLSKKISPYSCIFENHGIQCFS